MFFSFRKIVILLLLSFSLTRLAAAQSVLTNSDEIDALKTRVAQLLADNKKLIEEYHQLQAQVADFPVQLSQAEDDIKALEEKWHAKTENLRQMESDAMMKTTRQAYLQKELFHLKGKIKLKQLQLRKFEAQQKSLEGNGE